MFLPRLNVHDVTMFRSACSPSLLRWDSKKTPPTNSGKKQSKPLGLQKDSPDQVRSETVLISVPPKRLPQPSQVRNSPNLCASKMTPRIPYLLRLDPAKDYPDPDST